MITYLKDVFYGKRVVTDYARYEFARIGVAIVHATLLIIFIFAKCVPLIVFNCFSVVFYCFILEYLIRRRRYLVSLTAIYGEIVVHSLFASVVLGWQSDFSLYNIGLLYVAFYFSYLTTQFKHRILIPFILGFATLLLTLAAKSFVFWNPSISLRLDDNLYFHLSIMNYCITVFFIMLFAILHTVEIRRKEYELQTTNSELDILAHFDYLTNLRNRHSMEEELHEVLDHTTDNYCFIMGDIDDFKQFNDMYGHECGDYVLKSVAGIIQKNIGSSHLACRWGGEEILMLIKADEEYAHIIAEKIRFEIEHMNAIYHGTLITVTMTFGLFPYRPDISFEKCINHADQKMYIGKQNGKNCVVWNN